MKLKYYSDSDVLYIHLADRPGGESREVAPGIVLDLDSTGQLVGIDIDYASKRVDLSRLEAFAVPLIATP